MGKVIIEKKLVKQIVSYRVEESTFIQAVLLWTIAMEFLVTELELPSALRFINDAIVLFLFSRIVPNLPKLNKPQYKWIILAFFAFFVGIVVGVIGNLVPLRFIFWGGRNTFRFFTYFFACVIFLKRKSIERIMNLLLCVQAVNFILSLYQFFVLDRWSDALGGVFGYGNTTGTCGLCLMLVSYYFTMFLDKKTGFFRFVFAIVTSMIISALAEQKALFLILGIALVLGLLLTGLSVRKIVAVALCGVAFVVGLNILDSISSESFAVLSSFEDIMDYSQTTYEEGYRLPRIGSFEIIDARFFDGNWFNRAFGFGLGSCDFSSIAYFKSDFYRDYGYLNYRWFTHQWMFLENGYFGIISIVGFWLVNAFSLFIYRKKAKPENRAIIDTSIICSVTTILLMWLGPALKIDAGYIVYFGAAMGVAVLKDTIDERGYTQANTKDNENGEEEKGKLVDEERPDISYKQEAVKVNEEDERFKAELILNDQVDEILEMLHVVQSKQAKNNKIKDSFDLNKKYRTVKNDIPDIPDILLDKGHWVEETKK